MANSAAQKAPAKLAAYSVLVMGLSPTAVRFGHSLADSSIVQRLIRLTRSFPRHILGLNASDEPKGERTERASLVTSPDPSVVEIACKPRSAKQIGNEINAAYRTAEGPSGVSKPFLHRSHDNRARMKYGAP